MGESITVFKVIIGLVVAAIGVLIVYKAEWFLQNFGTINFAEKHFGTSGGTRMFIKLIGIGVAFIGFMVATGLWNQFLNWVLGPLIRMVSRGQGAP